MALKLKEYLNPQGYEVKEGYFELTNVSYDLKINLVQFDGDIYLSKEHKDGGFYPVDSFSDGFELHELPNENFVTYIYNRIKEISKLPEEELMKKYPKYMGFIGCEDI